ncbi:hypothetical protein DYI37_03265 [Fulvimarina endophytica]|uniref:Uncharacterized protein n=1 Tax=Fulvimarina endophytica TaxID=2293836 RepID=A0A371XB57_9HYPH|nr:hypothetical protein [Fulvimarina endophytica]RFC66475.1 hypothetical protein DYI37_03265 [Fulvimarina endophytica]
MSDSRNRENNNRKAYDTMTTIARETYGMLEVLTVSRHRGPRDTWGAARDRTAREIGLKPAYAKRLWERWAEMRDVSGAAYKAVREAYDAQCLKNEMMADHHAAVREMIANGATDEECRAADRRMAQALVGAAEEAANAKTGRAKAER